MPDRKPQARTPGPAAPIEVRGETLAKLRRNDAGKAPRVLRVSFEAFEGHPFVRLAMWTRDKAGAWIPLKGGVSIRVSELPEVIAALDLARARAGSGMAPDDQQGRQDRRGATGGGSADARAVEPPRRAVAAPARPPAVPRERPNGRRAVPDDPRRRWDPSTLPSPADVIASPDFDETSA